MKKPCSATCAVSGDPHIKTFDGRRYDMYGKCSYVLADHCHYGAGGLKEFEIIAKNSECGNSLYTSCVRSVLVNLTTINTRIALGTVTVNGHKVPNVLVNGKEETQVIKKDYTIEFVGDKSVLVQYKKNKLKIHWTGHNVYITVGYQYENQTCGLCGTYNSNKQDDFHTRSDAVETSVAAFTQSWIYNDKDVSQDPKLCHSTKWETSEKPCQIYSKKAGYADKNCLAIKNPKGPFARCFALEPPAEHYSMCRQDACKCDNCYCHVMAAYAKICMEKGVLIDGWRNETSDCGKWKLLSKCLRFCL